MQRLWFRSVFPAVSGAEQTAPERVRTWPRTGTPYRATPLAPPLLTPGSPAPSGPRSCVTWARDSRVLALSCCICVMDVLGPALPRCPKAREEDLTPRKTGGAECQDGE